MKDLVSALGDYLTVDKDEVRARGTLLLSEVLTRLPELPLPEQSLQTLINFFCLRLKDFP